MIAKLAILLVVAVTTATVSASRPEATDMSSLDSADNIVSKNGEMASLTSSTSSAEARRSLVAKKTTSKYHKGPKKLWKGPKKHLKGKLPRGCAPLPPGSWSAGTCKNYDNWCTTAPILSTDCLTNDGNWNKNKNFNTSFCVSSLSDSDGTLICDAHQNWVPGGSWTGTCTPVTLENDMLTARCLDFGKMDQVENTINTSRCVKYKINMNDATVMNNGGYLACGKCKEANVPLPPGSWKGACQRYDGWCATSPILNALCGDYGKKFNVKFNTTFCVSSISVVGGILVCDARQSWVPGGSWSGTCTPITYDNNNGILTAQCFDLPTSANSAFGITSSINTRLCKGGRVKNTYGHLVCESTV